MEENAGAFHDIWSNECGICSHLPETIGRQQRRRGPSTMVSIFFLIILLIGAFICWIDVSIISASFHKTQNHPKRIEIPLNCSTGDFTQTCSTNYPPRFEPQDSSSAACPDYFRWIHQDLQPWKSRRISREMVERAKEFAHFRLVIVKGKVYVENYKAAFQTRDTFTIWGILQLLRVYSGKLPDLELMFWCEDRPVIEKSDYQGPNAAAPPPLFHYCGHESTLDIVFPDWTFWGWAETNISPWGTMMKNIVQGNKRTKFKDRVPYAYWKGNPDVAPTRDDLMKCNVSDKIDWNARLYRQDWDKESEQGYKSSNLEDQCTHRYKIYMEGWGWSVSDKYIMACDSMTLLVKPHFHDFFIRSMVPLQHYWPIRTRKKCRDLKFAVEWGNNHIDKAQAIGEAASNFIQENLKMEYVYDYMFHILSEYSKLLDFEPAIPPGATEVCSETMACAADGVWKKLMEESMVKSPSDTIPCTMPPPYDPAVLQDFVERKENIMRQVESWESEYWEDQNKKQ